MDVVLIVRMDIKYQYIFPFHEVNYNVFTSLTNANVTILN